MVTGRASQSEPGGQWQLWALWYSFFCLYASAEIGFSAWISPYATLLDLAVSASAPATHLPNAYSNSSGEFQGMPSHRWIARLGRARLTATSGKSRTRRCSRPATVRALFPLCCRANS